jgi:hypothetical protein
MGKSELLPCPFCGEQPDVSTIGSCIVIDCCVVMDRQKSDYLTLEERRTWKGYHFGAEAEEKVFLAVADEWNNRAK